MISLALRVCGFSNKEEKGGELCGEGGVEGVCIYFKASSVDPVLTRLEVKVSS